MARTAAQIQTELDAWYAARTATAAGKTVSVTTSAGTRSVSQHDLSEINDLIRQLESELSAASTTSGSAFARANFRDVDDDH